MKTIVKNVTTIVDARGGRVSWSNQNVIAYDHFEEDGFYHLYTIQADGSDNKSITFGNQGISQLHNGQPSWHPSGNYLIFQSQDPALPRSQQIDASLAEPGAGFHCNLWITDPGGTDFHQLTQVKAGQYTLHAHFSHDGKQLTWSQNNGLMIADFLENPTPHLANIRELHPIAEGLETHSFSPDDESILLTALYFVSGESEFNNLPELSRATGAPDPSTLRLATAGIRELHIATGKVRNVTGSKEDWDEHAHYSPDGTKIIWATSRGYPYPGRNTAEVMAKTSLEYWMMNADGSNQRQITQFNVPGSREYVGGEIPAKPVDYSWSPDGTKIVACILRGVARELAQVVVIELAEE